MPTRPRDRHGFDVEPHGGQVFRGPAGRRVETLSHGTDSDSLIVILSGVFLAQWQEGAKRCEVNAGPGEVVFRLKGITRYESNDPASPLTAIVLYFRWADPPARLPSKVGDRMGLIRTLAQTILSIQAPASATRGRLAHAYYAAALAEYERLAGHEGEGLDGRLAQIVYQNLRAPLSLPELASKLHRSPRVLQREYKALTGHTPMHAVRRIRVEAAARLITASPALALKDVAFHVGIANEQELCKLLKRFTGLIASQLRAKGGARRPRPR
jgi:AraC-like DNA-binding protein